MSARPYSTVWVGSWTTPRTAAAISGLQESEPSRGDANPGYQLTRARSFEAGLVMSLTQWYVAGIVCLEPPSPDIDRLPLLGKQSMADAQSYVERRGQAVSRADEGQRVTSREPRLLLRKQSNRDGQR